MNQDMLICVPLLPHSMLFRKSLDWHILLDYVGVKESSTTFFFFKIQFHFDIGPLEYRNHSDSFKKYIKCPLTPNFFRLLILWGTFIQRRPKIFSILWGSNIAKMFPAIFGFTPYFWFSKMFSIFLGGTFNQMKDLRKLLHFFGGEGHLFGEVI